MAAALVGLVGAIIGGLLVLAGDLVRRRAERRQDAVRRLAEAATAFAVQYGRLVGQRRDAYLARTPPPDVRAERYEANIRFFITPGAEALRNSALAVTRSYQNILNSWDLDDHQAGFSEYNAAMQAFEAEVRAIVRRGSIPRSVTTAET